MSSKDCDKDTFEMDNIKHHYEEILKLLIIIASPADIQLAAYGLGNVEEEIAFDLEFHFKDRGSYQIESGFLSFDEAEAISKIDQLFEARSGNDDDGFLLELQTHKDWRLLRTMAKEVLIFMGKENLAIDIKTENALDKFSHQIIYQRIKVDLI
jgi:hypothetical protein